MSKKWTTIIKYPLKLLNPFIWLWNISDWACYHGGDELGPDSSENGKYTYDFSKCKKYF